MLETPQGFREIVPRSELGVNLTWGGLHQLDGLPARSLDHHRARIAALLSACAVCAFTPALAQPKGAVAMSQKELEAKFAQLEHGGSAKAPLDKSQNPEIDDELAKLKQKIRIG